MLKPLKSGSKSTHIPVGGQFLPTCLLLCLCAMPAQPIDQFISFGTRENIQYINRRWCGEHLWMWNIYTSRCSINAQPPTTIYILAKRTDLWELESFGNESSPLLGSSLAIYMCSRGADLYTGWQHCVPYIDVNIMSLLSLLTADIC